MRFEGYAAIFDAPDKGGDVIRRGAFARRTPLGIPLLWQHDPNRCIGYVESVSEDQHGLRVVAQLEDTRAETQVGTGLSFGYRVRTMKRQKYRELTDLELIEISVVRHPMQPLAYVLKVEN